MATKVGDGYIEVEPRFNRQMWARDSGNMGRESSTAFNKGFTRGTRQLSQNVDEHFRKNLTRSLGQSLKIFEKNVSHTNDRVGRRFDRDSRGWGLTIGHQLMEAVHGVLSLLPSRLEAIFTKTGPVIGTALYVAIAAGLAVALPALGAMISGVFFLSLGFGGAIAAAIVGAVKDPRVNKAVDKLSKTFNDRIIMDKHVQSLGATLAHQLDRVNAALKRWAPHIQSILLAGAKFLGPITTGLIGFVNAILPALDRLMKSPFMTGLVKIAAEGLIRIGRAIATIFDRFLKNPKAMEGATLGLKLFFDILVWGIDKLGVFMVKMSEFWTDLNNKSKTGTSAIGHIRDAFASLGQAIQTAVSWVKAVLVPAFGIFMSIITPMFPAIKKVADVIGGALQGAFGAIKESVQWFNRFLHDNPEMANILAVAIGTLTASLVVYKSVALAVRGATLLWAAAQWLLTGGLLAAMGPIGIIIAAVVALAVVAYLVIKHWSGISRFFSDMWKNIKNWFTDGMRWIKDLWDGVWGWVKAHGVSWWNNIWGFFVGWLDNIKNWFTNSMRFLKNLWNGTWQWIKDTAGGIWNTIYGGFQGWLNNIQNWFTNSMRFIKNLWNTAWQWIKDRAAAIWNTIWIGITGWFNQVGAWFWQKLVALRNAWSDIWNGMHRIAVGVWGKITHVFENGINAIINIINAGIRLINAALSGLGVSFKIPTLGHVGAQGAMDAVKASGLSQNKARKNRATGGPVFGPGTSTSDSIPAMLSTGEYVINAASAKNIGYGNLDTLNAFASGGRVGPGNNGLLNEHRDHVHVAMMQGINYIIGLAKKSGIPYRVTSTFRPGATVAGGGASWHASGKAVDFGGFNQDAFASFWLGVKGVMELIHRTNKRDYAIFGGKGDRSGAGGGGLFGFLGRGWNWVLEHLLRPAGNKALDLFGQPKNAVSGFGKGWLGTIFNKTVDKAKVEFDQAQKDMAASGGDPASYHGRNENWRGTVMQALAMRHLPQSWVNPMLKLIDRESGGNPNARSFSSNGSLGFALGLAQLLQSTFRAYMFPGHGSITAPLDNILASLGYIKARYGSVFNVAQAVGARPNPGGYDNGGWWLPGTAGVNLSGSTEMVLNNAQGAALEKRIAGDGGSPTNINVYIDGVKVAHRAVVEESNAKLIEALQRR